MSRVIDSAFRMEMPTMRTSHCAALTLATTAVVLAGCPVMSTEDLELPIGGQVASIQIDPSSVTLTVGDTHDFVASAFGMDGGEIAGANVAWSVTDTAIAEIEGNDRGLEVKLKAKSLGTTTLKASWGGREATATVTVVSDVDSVVLSGPVEAVLGDGIVFVVEARDRNGKAIQRAVTLSTSNDRVLRRPSESAGSELKLQAVGVGQVTVEARVGGVRSNALTVTVKPHALEWEPRDLVFPAGSSGTLELAILGRSGEAPLENLGAIELSTTGEFSAALVEDHDGGSESRVVHVTSSTGGQGTVTASLFGVTATASVRAVAPATIEIIGSTEPLIAGEERTFTAVVKDDSGAVIDGAPIHWYTGHEWGRGTGALEGEDTGPTFTPTAHSVGRGSVWAQSGGVSNAVHLLVKPARVDVEISRTTLALGDVVTVRGIARLPGGETVTRVLTMEGEQDFTWSITGHGFAFLGEGTAAAQTIVANSKGAAQVSLALFGVESDPVGLSAVEVVGLSIAGDDAPLEVNERRAFTATVVTDPPLSSGESIPVSWADENGILVGSEAGDTVDLWGYRVGLASLTAQVGGGSAIVTSDPFVVAVVPAGGADFGIHLDAGYEWALNPTPVDHHSNTIPHQYFDGSWSWTVDDDTIATIDIVEGSPRIQGLRVGTTVATGRWVPPTPHPAWDDVIAEVTATIVVGTSPAPVDGIGDYLVEWTGFATWALSFPQASDVGTAQADLKYEVYGTKTGEDPFAGMLLTVVDAEPDGQTMELLLDISADVPVDIRGAHPGWSFGVRAVDEEDQRSHGVVFEPVIRANPVPGEAVVIGAKGRLVALSADDFAHLGDVSTGPYPGVEWTSGSIAADGALVGIGNFGGRQLLFRRPEGATSSLAEASLGSVATEPSVGSCSPTVARPVTAFGARATFEGASNSDVVVYTATEGRLSCSEAVLVMRDVATKREQLLAPAVTRAAGWDSTAWYLLPTGGGSLWFQMNLATGDSEIVTVDSVPLDTLLAAHQGAGYALIPSLGRLIRTDSGGLLTLDHPDLGDARGFSVGNGFIALEKGNGDFYIADLEVVDDDLVLSNPATLSATDLLGGVRFTIGASR